MQIFYIVCFFIGLVYTLTAFIVTEILERFNFDNIKIGFGKYKNFKATVIAAFVMSFGGAGHLLSRHLVPFAATLIISIAAAFLAAVIINSLMKKLTEKRK
ncbi:MAG: hypothetical protein FWE82_06665 [Defluviitaleaceae bacterium]|nr:hypothetical protein [Defluviitaleaceae bacterium]